MHMEFWSRPSKQYVYRNSTLNDQPKMVHRSTKEKEIVSTTKVINNYTNNFYGNASEVDISQG